MIITLTVIFVITLLTQMVLHHNERQDLYNRLMSRDLGEYLTIDAPKNKAKRQNYFKKSMSHAYRAMYGKNDAE